MVNWIRKKKNISTHPGERKKYRQAYEKLKKSLVFIFSI